MKKYLLVLPALALLVLAVTGLVRAANTRQIETVDSGYDVG